MQTRMETLQAHSTEEFTGRRDYKQAEAFLKTGYAKQVRQYREDDEIEVNTEHHRHLHCILEALSKSFDHPIRVLDAGCGTGRYFHCIRNATEIVALDLCPEMLEAARSPVLAQHVSAGKISLVCANIFETDFPPASFDLIYSIGMFALGCPISAQICEKFHEWLTPGGRLFFNVTDRAGIPWPKVLRRRVRNLVYRAAPAGIKTLLDHRSPHPEVCALTRDELAALMRLTPFNGRTRVISQPCLSPLWQGRHLECLAWKKEVRPLANPGRMRKPQTAAIGFSHSLPVGF